MHQLHFFAVNLRKTKFDYQGSGRKTDGDAEVDTTKKYHSPDFFCN